MGLVLGDHVKVIACNCDESHAGRRGIVASIATLKRCNTPFADEVLLAESYDYPTYPALNEVCAYPHALELLS